MFRKILLAGAALATLAIPATANAQYRTYGTYGHGRHYYWDGHHYRDRSSNVIVDSLIAGVLGYAIGSLGSSYAYPYGYNYGYSSPYYGNSYYGNSYYSYPAYNYNYQCSYPSYGYGYSNYCYNPYRY